MSKGPTDNAIKDFRDSYDESKRYKKKHKRNRRKAKEELSKLKNKNLYEIEAGEEE